MTYENEHDETRDILALHTIETTRAHDANDVTTLRIAYMIDDEDDAIDALHVTNIRVMYCATLFAYVARNDANVILRNVHTRTLHAIAIDEYNANAYVAHENTQTTRMHVAIALFARHDV